MHTYTHTHIHTYTHLAKEPNASIAIADYAFDVHPVEIALDPTHHGRPTVEGCILHARNEYKGDQYISSDRESTPLLSMRGDARNEYKGDQYISSERESTPLLYMRGDITRPSFNPGPWEVSYRAITPKFEELHNL